MTGAKIAALIAIAGCRPFSIDWNSVYVQDGTRYSVEQNWRDSPAGNVWPLRIGSRGEPGPVNPGVIEFVFGADGSPFARYYDLVLSLPRRPRVVDSDLAALQREMTAQSQASQLTGRDYARALGRGLAVHINVALRAVGSAGVLWGIPVDLDAGVPLVEYEREGVSAMPTTLLRHAGVALLIVHSRATQDVQVWDLDDVPGAFEASPVLDHATVAAHIVSLHPGSR